MDPLNLIFYGAIAVVLFFIVKKLFHLTIKIAAFIVFVILVVSLLTRFDFIGTIRGMLNI